MVDISDFGQTVASIAGQEPMRENEYPFFFTVGVDGVTSIELHKKDMGTYDIDYYTVKKGDQIAARMNALYIECITYQEAA